MLARASGYLVILIPPVLLPLSLLTGVPLLAFVTLILVAPLLRILFGDAQGDPPPWSEGLACVLHWLPVVSAIAYVAATAMTWVVLHRARMSSGALTGLACSLWAVHLFASCVAHELVHRSDVLSRSMGQVLSGLIGYPLLEHEHRMHHLRNGDTQAAESARLGESVWAFTLRRLARVVSTARESDALMAARHGHPWAGGLPLSLATTLATAIGFTWAQGLAGGVMYVSTGLAVAWSLQAMTYIQHWGLGRDAIEGEQAASLGWEDDCRMQSWLTLGISFHQTHHRSGAVPYYRLGPTEDAPKAPAGYVVLFFASLVPPLWRALMVPAWRRWQCSPRAQRTAGRRLVCVRFTGD